jgi:regulator of nucleoside diphosphate kinase
VGRQVGDIINWPFRDGERKLEILEVETIWFLSIAKSPKFN